ncbi:cytochrome P450 [Lentinus tigrinus ALCF2SS1-7]|uniref:Cytochrome P450 n=1 Tax=Lentinus tigrinus ALCF2SS1-6 TaxID=1328759 RepID=A0A5C2RVS5_9APHY|nr:cytochrome P450 [Lentinus tigrinus ALCF2SS1-6]RPD71302.1 cytochrome P450 [Lentinus tigrinus ALCF2SS1-7]
MNLTTAAVVAAMLYALWRVFRNYVVAHPMDNLPGPSATTFLFGNIPEFAGRQSWKRLADLAETYGPALMLRGVLWRRLIMIHDPKALHGMLVKEQEFLQKGLAPANVLIVLLGPGVLSTRTGQHRRQRKLLNPVFSVAHLRNMTHIFYSIAHKVKSKLQAALKSRLPEDGTADVLDMNGWNGRTTLEMLGQAGLGYSFDNFAEESSDEYGDSLKLFFPTLNNVQLFPFVVEKMSYVLSVDAMRRLFRILPFKELKRLMHISDTLQRRSQEIIDERKEALQKGDEALLAQVGEGKDLMSICLKANLASTDAEKMTDDELLAQTSTFILAGMDTTSNALSRILHLLAQNPAVQDKLRAELLIATAGGTADLDYDGLMNLPYLDAVCRETLRVYAPVDATGRVAAKDLVLPLSAPVRGRDGVMISELVVPQDTVVFAHFQASNVNRELWGEDAEEWKPDRWLAPLSAALENAHLPGVYANLMTFSGGVRSCIGFKFSQLEMKVVLAVLLTSFSFELTDQPVVWNSSAVIYPTMGEESTKPEMLLKVKVLR